jgi:hypothetical protein
MIPAYLPVGSNLFSENRLFSLGAACVACGSMI